VTASPPSNKALSGLNWARITQNLGFGAAGGFVGYLLSEMLIDVDNDAFMTQNEMRIQTGYWFALILLGIGAALLAGLSLLTRTPPATETILIGVAAFLIGGFVSGYIAQLVYENMVNWDSEVTESDIRLPRAIGWLIAGGLGGSAVGLSFKSVKRVQNGVMGGAAGGFVGGLLFDSFGSASTARMFGIIFVGALMGGLIGLIESARTAVWLSVVSGELRGRQFPLVDEVSSVGRARSNRVCLPGDSAIAEKHLDIRVDEGGASFTSVSSPLVLNGTSVMSGRLSHGDLLTVGRTDIKVEFRKATVEPGSSGVPSAPPSNRPIDQTQATHGIASPQPLPSRQAPAARPVIPVQRPD